ncbi:hypothetical protein HCY80_09185 [Limosilactobacillus fermentum]
MAHAVDVPVFADADTGYGTTAQRMVRDFEQAGVAGLFIEDRV